MSSIRLLIPALVLLAAASLPAQAQSDQTQLVLVVQQDNQLRIAHPPYTLRRAANRRVTYVTAGRAQWSFGRENANVQRLKESEEPAPPQSRSNDPIRDITDGLGVALPSGETPVAVSISPDGSSTVTTTKDNGNGTSTETTREYDSGGNNTSTSIDPPKSNG